MGVLGIIAEYNPFHNGHALHLQKSKQQTGCEDVCVVMSGNFVQRGEPALVDKLCRTRMALLAGADIVIELPVYYATASAEYFARGAVKLLHASGIVSHLCFGSETGQLAELSTLAQLLLLHQEETNIGFSSLLKQELGTGLGFIVARQQLLEKGYPHAPVELLKTPNNLLAVAYLKALLQLDSPIIAHTIKREGAGYHDALLNQPLASATAIRKAIDEGQLQSVASAMPPYAYGLLCTALSEGPGAAQLDRLSLLFQYIIKQNDVQWLKGIQDVTEGLENRMASYAAQYFHLSDIITQTKTKRYTFTKIRRIVLHALLGLQQKDFDAYEALGGPLYLRVLGFRREKAYLLRQMEEKATLPMVLNLKHAHKQLSPTAMALAMLEKEIETTDIYRLSTSHAAQNPAPQHIEYTQPLVIL